MTKHTILLVEDEKVQRDTLAAHLEESGRILTAETAEEAIGILKSQTVDLVITDFNLPGMDGQTLLEQTRSINPTIPVIMITAFGTIDNAVEAMQKGAYHYITKPINIDELLLVLNRALQHKVLMAENKRLRETLNEQHAFKGVIASSRKMEEVLNLAGRVAGTTASILLFGESGTGKEVMARAIHYASDRTEGPFVAFNVAALSPTLIESELFGHEKGAFTGADRQRAGRFEQADTGTIFIDEIGDIPLELQTRFLRVLQENTISRLGGDREIPVNIRVIAATNKDLEAMIKRSDFREDLYYRLNVVTITIPPLRERREDIAPLSQHFLSRYSEANKKKVRGFSREAFDTLMKYAFPGNVRELENLVERAVILCRGEQITLDDLPPNVFREESLPAGRSVDAGLEATLETIEKEMLLTALKQAGWNQSKAARNLQITERKLRYKIQKYGLQPK